MKNLKILSLIALSAFSASQLRAKSITMTFDSSCAGVTQVWVQFVNGENHTVIEKAFPQSKDGKLFMDFGKTMAGVVDGTLVKAMCMDTNDYVTCSSRWVPATDDGVFTCSQ